MRTSSAFETAYRALNSRQREAVDAIEGPVMVIAGPGTGKTQILAMRIANILLTTDTSPDAILAISFTESAAAAMRARVVSLVGERGYRVHIHTFHSFGNTIIQNYPEEFPDIIGAQPISETEQLRIIEALLTEGTYSLIRPLGNPTYYVKAIYKAIHTLKRENITPEVYAQIVEKERRDFSTRDDIYHTKGVHIGKMKGDAYTMQKKIQKNEELVRIYDAYTQRMHHDHWYDFEDMIMEVVRAWERHEDFLRSIQERFLYFLIDEHQDTNNAQNAVLDALCNFDHTPNLFLVGDEKQAIYRFQGASFENFMHMKDRYPDMRIVVLEDNYRSQQGILDAVHGMSQRITKDPAILKGHTAYQHQPLSLCVYEHDDEEISGVAQSIAERIDAGVHPSEIAVLYRDNYDARAITRELKRRNIAYDIDSDRELFEDPMVRSLVKLLHVVHHPFDDEALAYVLHIPPMGVHPLDVCKVMHEAYEKKEHIATHLKRIADGTDAHVYENKDALVRAYRMLMRWLYRREKVSPLLLIDEIVKESGVLLFTDTDQDQESWRAVKRIYTELERVYERHTEYTYADMIAYIDYMRTEHLMVRGSTRVVGDHQVVRCMTAHRSKGLEFEYVYIIYAYDGHWGGKRVTDLLPLLPRIYGTRAISYAHTDEDRRLLYVALTRAKKEASVSYSRYDDMGRERLPSAYLEEISQEALYVTHVPHRELLLTDHTVQPTIERLSDRRERMRQLIQTRLYAKGISVTALNNYLTCPWRYVYVNLLGIPQPQSIHQLFGTVVHAVLREARFYRTSAKNVEDMIDHSMALLESYVSKKPIPASEYAGWLDRGKKIITAYIPHIYSSPNDILETELRIDRVPITDQVFLRGAIDRIDKTPEGTLVVIDYKTGKHKSSGEITGKTKTSTGNIFRQLVFYKILLDAYDHGVYHMHQGAIVFVEPDEKGICHTHEFEINTTHTKDLRDVLYTTIHEIEQLSFWNTRCDDTHCPYCAMRFMIREDNTYL